MERGRRPAGAMMPVWPHFGEVCLFAALLAAFGLSVWQWLPERWARHSAPASLLLGGVACACVGAGFFGLMAAYIGSDFTLVNVAANSHSTKPLFYKISGVWGNHEGSLLLWVLMLAALGLWGGRYAARHLPHAAAAYWRIWGVMLWGFLVFALFASNPFVRQFPAPEEGMGLNPILQDVALAAHPPLLYLGYVGFGVVSILALALLISGRFSQRDAFHLKRWALLALGVLTWGIALGSWWAYRELGWGGYWFWDPVENASLLPWLAGAALVHTLWTVERRNLLQGWALLLAFIACILALLGTFLVRSGVLTSVHAFASDPDRGGYLLIFLLAASVAGFGAYAMRGHLVARHGFFATVSKENALVWNNLLLCMMLCAVLMGTLYPLFMQVFQLPSISVGEPYFRQTALPVSLAAIVLAAAAPHIRWRADRLRRILTPKALAATGCAAALAAAAWVAMPYPTPLAVSGAAASSLLVLSVGFRLWQAAGRRADRLPRLFRLPQLPARGMDMAHLGFALLGLGASLHAGYAEARDAALARGDTAAVAGYTVRYTGYTTGRGPDFLAFIARFDVRHPSGYTREVRAEKRHYPIQQVSTTEASTLRVMPFGHVYLAIGEVGETGTVALRLHYNPWVMLVWAGGFLIGLGSVLAALRRPLPAGPA